MVKLKKRFDEFQNISGDDSSNSDFSWVETDAEFSEKWDKAEQEMLEGDVISLEEFINDTSNIERINSLND